MRLLVVVVACFICLPNVAPAEESLGRVEQFSLPDASGITHTRSSWQESKAIVLVFLGTECPVSNGYAPEMIRLVQEFSSRGVKFVGVHCDPDVTKQIAAQHAREYGLSFPILLDPQQILARPTGAQMMPEAVVLLPDGEVAYRGRIDDRYSEAGQRRLEAKSRDLKNAIDAVLAGKKPAPAVTKAFGCPLPRLTKTDETSR